MATPALAARADDEVLVVGREVRAVDALGQVEVAEDLAARAHRHAEEAVHRRVPGREADGPRVVGDGVQPDRLRLLDERAEHAAPGGQVADQLDHVGDPCPSG